MAVPKYDELMKPMLVGLKDGEEHKVNDIASLLAQQFKLSAEDRAEIVPSGGETVFKNRVGWAKTYLKEAGLLESPERATIKITEAGKKVVAENPEKIDSKYLEQFSSFLDFKFGIRSEDSGKTVPEVPKLTDLTPDDQLEEAYNQINDSLASDLLNEILKMDPRTFESFVVELLSKMGYGKKEYGSHATVFSGDGGIDGVIMGDKLGFSLIYMQAKEWNPDKSVDRTDIQQFFGAIAGKEGNGLFVTTGTFTKGAKDFAETKHIILIDGERLVNLMIEYNFCVSTRKTYEIKEIDTDALSKYLYE